MEKWAGRSECDPREDRSGRVKIHGDIRHIAAAQSIPIADLEKRLREIPKRSTVVAYCRGPYCVFADEAVALLRKHGYAALRLQTGFPEWKMQGLPIGTGMGAGQ